MPQNSVETVLAATGPCGCGKSTIMNICKAALKGLDYSVSETVYGYDSESIVIRRQLKTKAAQIEYHRQEIARLTKNCHFF